MAVAEACHLQRVSHATTSLLGQRLDYRVAVVMGNDNRILSLELGGDGGAVMRLLIDTQWLVPGIEMSLDQKAFGNLCHILWPECACARAASLHLKGVTAKNPDASASHPYPVTRRAERDRCPIIDSAKIARPPSASNAPTQPVDAQPMPAEMVTPPSHAPKALAALNAEWFNAAASVWASPATSIRRVCRQGPSATRVPTSSTLMGASHGLLAVNTKSESTAIAQTSRPPMVGNSARSASLEPTRLPTTIPAPNNARTIGTTASGKWVSSIIVGLMSPNTENRPPNPTAPISSVSHT